MPRVDIDFTDVGFEQAPIPDGMYALEVVDVPEVIPTKAGTGDKVVMNYKIVEAKDEKLNNRRVSDHIPVSLSHRINRMAAAHGLILGADGLQTETLLGLRCKVVLKSSTSKDKETGEERIWTNVREYILPEQTT